MIDGFYQCVTDYRNKNDFREVNIDKRIID